MEATPDEAKPKVGISACLLGQKVRYDGGHKRDYYLTEIFGRFVDWVPVCPEVEIGMAVPRESVRLVGTPERARMIAEKSGKDWTSAMRRFAGIRTSELAPLNLSGYIFKKNSPSCGVEKVRVYSSKDLATRDGRGLFAAAVIGKFPLMPVEEEGRLNDPALRENYIERVFAYARWQQTSAERNRWGISCNSTRLTNSCCSPTASATIGSSVAWWRMGKSSHSDAFTTNTAPSSCKLSQSRRALKSMPTFSNI